jgi:hypothetical protein
VFKTEYFKVKIVAVQIVPRYFSLKVVENNFRRKTQLHVFLLLT